MPFFLIPIALGGASLCSLAFGGKKVKEGLDGVSEAKKIVEDAQSSHKNKLEELDTTGKALVGRFESFGQHRLKIRTTTFPSYVSFLKRLNKRVREKALQGQIGGVDILSPGKIQEFEGQFLEAQTMLASGLSAAAVGAAAGQGAVALVGMYGTAATGTAIGGLSGAAAQSAMLAWLGGGSLAAGGGGMFLGTIVLGGICVAPGALLAGFTFAKQGQKALTQAHGHRAEINVANSKITSQIAFVSRLSRRVDELDDLQNRLDQRASFLLNSMVPESLDPDNRVHMNSCAILFQLMQGLSEVLKIAPLGEDGEISRESGLAQKQYGSLAGV